MVSDLNFKDEIKKRDSVIVLFYASWCPFSRKFLPIFEEHAKRNPQECLSVVIDDIEHLCEEYSLEYYPTIIHFKNGKISKRLDSEHGIGLTEEDFKEFLCQE